jgi:hypothetical protein
MGGPEMSTPPPEPFAAASVAATSAIGTQTASVAQAVPAGYSILVACATNSPGTSGAFPATGITDSAGNQYTPDGSSPGGSPNVYWFTCVDCLALPLGGQVISAWGNAATAGRSTYAVAVPSVQPGPAATAPATSDTAPTLTGTPAVADGWAIMLLAYGQAGAPLTATPPAELTTPVLAGPYTAAMWRAFTGTGPVTVAGSLAASQAWRARMWLFGPGGAPPSPTFGARLLIRHDGEWEPVMSRA